MYIKVITYFCAMLALGMFINVCDAQIDPEKIVGIWLLDEGKGNEVGDVSGNDKKALQPNQIGLTEKLMAH